MALRVPSAIRSKAQLREAVEAGDRLPLSHPRGGRFRPLYPTEIPPGGSINVVSWDESWYATISNGPSGLIVI